MRYELVILGNGPEARAAALAAANRGWLTALVEPADERGAVSLAAMRDVSRQLVFHTPAAGMDVPVLATLLRAAANRERQEWNDRLLRNGIQRFAGHARFLDTHGVSVETADDFLVLDADRFLIANGTRTARPSYIPFNGRTIIAAEELLELAAPPRSLICVGLETYGRQLAELYQSAGVQVQFVRADASFLGIEETPGGAGVRFQDGRLISASAVLYNATRMGRVDELCVEAAGLLADEHGCLWCDAAHRTWASHIFACRESVVSATRAAESIIHSMGELQPVDAWASMPVMVAV